MKITLYAAISADGFIATDDGNSDWAKDDELFEKTTKEFGCVVMGSNTFNQFQGDIYPIEGVQHLILTTKDAGLDMKYSNVTYINSPQRAVQKAQDLGFDSLLVIGGGQCNGSFAQASLLDEVWLDEHPIKLGNGIKLLGDHSANLNLELISNQKYPDFTQNKFKVNK